MLTDDQRRALVAAARASVSSRVGGAKVTLMALSDLPTASGVFVTLKCSGRLRGCLGVIDMAAPLGAEVVRCAADAATSDPRFPPLTHNELTDLSIEVSVLGPLERIDPRAPEAIVLGRHGLVIELGDRRGLLLPQVALEWQWSREQFLRQTCLKAMLAPDAWQHGASVYRFDADVFGD
jgi:hypothetical protein